MRFPLANAQRIETPRTNVPGCVECEQSGLKGSSSFRRATAGSAKSAFSLVEVMISLGLIGMTIVASVQAMLVSNRMAAANRLTTAARAIVQRNIDTALTLRFDSTVTPAILGITTGTNYDDDGGGDGSVNILTQKNAAGNLVPAVKGTLRRKVTAISNSLGADIRRVEFRLTYTFQNRPYAVEMSTVRTIDD